MTCRLFLRTVGNEIHPFRVDEIACGGEIALRAVKSASTAGGWISFHIGEGVISHFAVRQNISLSRIFSVSLDLFTQICYHIFVSGQPRRLRLDPCDACRLDQYIEREQPRLKKHIYTIMESSNRDFYRNCKQNEINKTDNTKIKNKKKNQ